MSVDLPRSIELTEQISPRATRPAQADRLRGRAGRDRPALRPRGGDRGRRPLPRDRRASASAPRTSRSSPTTWGSATWRPCSRAYAGGDGEQPIGELVAAEGSPTPSSTSTPALAHHEPPTSCCSGFGDESADYLWKVLASRGDACGCYRDDPDAARRDRRAGDQQGDPGGGLSPGERDRRLRRPGRDRGRDRRRRAGAAARSSRGSAGSPTPTSASSRPSSTRTPSSTARCARRRWRRSPTWPGLVRNLSDGRDAAAGDQRGPRPRATRSCSCSRTRRRPRSTRCTRPAGRSTSAATTSPSARRAAFQYVLDRLQRAGADRLRDRAGRDPRHRLELGASCST